MRIIRKIIQWFLPEFKHKNLWEKYLIVSDPKLSMKQIEEISEDIEGLKMFWLHPEVHYANPNFTEKVRIKIFAYGRFGHLI